MIEDKYKLFKQDLADAKAWMEDNGMVILSYHDVAMLRVSHKIGEIKKETVEAIQADPKRMITEIDYCVDFLKLTKKTGAKDVTVYSYTMPYTPVGLLEEGRPMYNGKKCRYMPEGVVIPVGHEENDTDTEIVLGRGTTGKKVCDQVDKVGSNVVREPEWVPSINYREDRDRLPKVSSVVGIPTAMVNSISLLGILGKTSYKYNKIDDFNGIIVTPVKALYNQIVDANLIAQGE